MHVLLRRLPGELSQGLLGGLAGWAALLARRAACPWASGVSDESDDG